METAAPRRDQRSAAVRSRRPSLSSWTNTSSSRHATRGEMPAAPLISGRLHQPGALARPGRSPVVCARADRALAFCPRGHPLVHNEASPEVPGARRRRASSDFWRVFGELGREIWLARAKVGVQSRGLRNRRSEVRILSGALVHWVFGRFERRSGTEASSRFSRGIERLSSNRRFSGDFCGDLAASDRGADSWKASAQGPPAGG